MCSGGLAASCGRARIGLALRRLHLDILIARRQVGRRYWIGGKRHLR